MSSIPELGFENYHARILDDKKHSTLNQLLASYSQNYKLCCSFIYEGFPSNVQPKYTWTSDYNTYFIIDKSNSGFKYFPNLVKTAFDTFSIEGYVYVAHTCTSNLEDPEVELKKILANWQTIKQQREAILIQLATNKPKFTNEELALINVRGYISKKELWIIALKKGSTPAKNKKDLVTQLLNS